MGFLINNGGIVVKEKKYTISFIVGSTILGLLLLMVIISIFYTPYDPNAINGAEKFMSPSWKHLFGTDNYGRDVFSRTLEGLKTTFVVAIATVLIGAFFGTVIGAFTGYVGGVLDEIIMRINDALASFPSVLVAMVMMCIIGTGKDKLIIIMGIVFIPSFARIMRSEYIKLKNRDFVSSAELMGCGTIRIMFVHIFPNTLETLIPSIAIGFNNAVLTEASLSYLGIGVQPPNASLGRILSESQGYFSKSWCVLFPGLLMVLMILSFVLFSESAVRRNRR